VRARAGAALALTSARSLDRLAVAARRRKHELLEELWSRCGRQDLFPLMRLLLPQLDLERSVYGLRELGLARIYADILGVAPDSEVAQRLRNYRVPLGAGAGAPKVAGDFAAVLLDVLEGRCVARNDALTLGAVNATLDELNSKTEPADKRAVFVRVLATYTARQQYWLARIVLKDLKVGVRHESALKLFHERALDVYNATTDLRRVCASVLDGRLLTQELSEVCLFKPFRPMLCGKQPWDRVVAAMGGARFVVQPKARPWEWGGVGLRLGASAR
jgi:DNA ligase-4